MRFFSAYLAVARALVLFALVSGLVVSTTGCSRSESIDPEMSEVVRGYGQGLVSALAAETLDGIRPYSTPAQADRVRLYVILITEERQQMITARLIAQNITATTLNDDGTATVLADEEWSLVYSDRGTGEISDREEYTAPTTYTLVPADGSWLVDTVSTQ